MRFVKVCFLLSFLALVCASSSGQRFSEWSPRVNIGAPVNTQFLENQAFLSKDGLSLYFTRLECVTCSTGAPQNIWVAHREKVDDPWGTPVKLPDTINSPAYTQATASVSKNGHFLLFASPNRPDGYGKQDIYISFRSHTHDDSDWGPAANIGAPINGPAGDRAPVLFEDEDTGRIVLFFTSNRSGNDDLYTSTLQPDGTWGEVVPIAELNSSVEDSFPVLSRDGLEIYFVSYRPGSMVSPGGAVSADIWTSTRASTSDPWSTPQPVTALNSPNFEGRPALSFDGSEIYFNTVHTPDECSVRGQCNVSMAWDIWKSTRTKLTVKDK